MRPLILFILPALVVFGFCAKPKTKNPVPVVEFLDLKDAGISAFSKADTATMVLSYEDGDGDLFVDNFSEGPNLIFTTYIYDEVNNKFVAEINTQTLDTARYTNTIKQPDNGYYKGKSIRGEIYIPLGEFRQSRKSKKLKFVGFIIDKKQHKSNVFSSPVYTLNF
jgi:hypothetical protein